MPIAPASWRVHLRRDTPLRELLRALYRHRDAVLAYYPHVPLTKERTPVGALILLWERWDYVRGHCPKCRSVVLGVSFGGLLSCGSVTGCCLGCARLVSRFIGGAGLIQSAIHKFLHDTPYRLTLTAQLPPRRTLASSHMEVGGGACPGSSPSWKRCSRSLENEMDEPVALQGM